MKTWVLRIRKVDGWVFRAVKLGKKIDLILTGRDAPQELIEIADIVSEIKEVKHLYNEGKKARRGIEY